MGKVEGRGKLWHGHVTALSITPEYRRLGLANKTMKLLEDVTEHQHRGYFVDLFVRKSNDVALQLYTKLGYIVYRRVLNYYSGDDPEDAYDMRKALPRDKLKESVVPLKKPVHPWEIEIR